MNNDDPTFTGAILTEMLEILPEEMLEILPELEDIQLAMLGIALQNEIDRRAYENSLEEQSEKPTKLKRIK